VSERVGVGMWECGVRARVRMELCLLIIELARVCVAVGLVLSTTGFARLLRRSVAALLHSW
jgi:hypothetical protein